MYKFLFILVLILNNLLLAGQCVQGDCMNGQGRIIFKDSSEFEGEFSKGKPLQGVFKYRSGDRFDGQFLNNKKHGFGVYNYSNGDVFKGEFAEDKKFFGSYVYKDGSEYYGGYKSNKPHGQGTYYSKDRKAYEVIYDNGELKEKMDMNVEGDSLILKTRDIKSFVVNDKYKMPRVFALVVGIADYEGSGADLRYSDDDASLFYNNLIKAMPAETAAGETSLLLNQNATQEKISNTLKSMFAKAGQNDYVIFYFSGHGSKGFFCPYRINSSQLRYDFVADQFEKSKAKFKLCIADACFSGGLTSNGHYSPSYTSDLNSERIALVMSSKPDQTSMESSDIKQGYFSYYLIKGMRGNADLNNDSYITMGEVFMYTKKMVEKKSQGRQIPVVFGQDMERIPLARVKKM